MHSTANIRTHLDASQRGREFAQSLTVGARVTCSADFTSPIGASFRAGHGFTVESIGTVNIRLRADVCGSVVWIALGDGRFYTDAWR
jgi:hypothetical protein